MMIPRARLAMFLILGFAATTVFAAPGESNRADVYQANQLNTPQKTEIVTILMVAPARVSVDNLEAKRNSQIGGALLGATLGGILGNNAGGHTGTGGAVGGAAGLAAGSMTSDTELVDGVTLTFSKNGEILSSTQVGRSCEFLVNKPAVIISSKSNETRIQPNGGECPVAQE